MEQDSSTIAASPVAIGLGVIVAIGLYVFFCHCLKLICRKAGHEPGALIWIPLVNLIPLLTVAKLPVWLIIAFLIPVVNVIVSIVMWVKICQALGKSGWLVIMMFIPLVNLAFIPYLAFSE